MKKLRIYLDTSVINFLFADDAPEKRDATVDFFDRVARHSMPVCISQLVLDEIGQTPDRVRREKLLAVIRQRRLPLLPAEPGDEVEALVKAYVGQGAIPAHSPNDALHVAICTVNAVDVLASWNFKHLANVSRERRIRAVNEALGYVYPLRIASPEEVSDDE